MLENRCNADINTLGTRFRELAAASEAGVERLSYHTSDSELAAVISSTLEVWREKHWTVGHLVRALLSYAAQEEGEEEEGSQRRFFKYSTDRDIM